MGVDIDGTDEKSDGNEAGSDSEEGVEASVPDSHIAQLLYDHSRDRYRPIWCILIPMIVGIPIYFGAYIAVTAAVQQFLSPNVTILATLTGFAGRGLGLLLGALIVAYLVSRMDRRPLIRYDWTTLPTWFRDFSVGVLIGAVATIIAVGYLTVRGYLSLAVAPTGVGVDSGGLSLAVVLLFSFFILSNSIFEEVLFRGIVLEQTARGLRPHARRISPVITGALIISVLIFGLFHFRGGINDVVTSAILGVFFGVAYLLTGRLAVAIGVHFGGGLPFYSVVQMPLPLGNRLTLPSVVIAEVEEVSPLLGIELSLVRVIVGIALLVGLSYLIYDEVRIHERFYAQPS